MTIRSQISLILLGAFALVVVATEAVQRYVVYPGFVTLEREAAATDADRAVQAVQREIEALSSFCLDWAAWDDMYRYVQDKNENFESNNLVVVDFYSRSNLPVLYVYDTQGNVVWGKSFDLETMNEVPVSLLPQTGAGPDNPLFRPNIDAGEVRGIILTEHGPMMVSSRPIVKSDLSGPPMGRLIFGRYINAAVLDKIAGQTSVQMQTWTMKDALPADVLPTITSLQAEPSTPLIAEAGRDTLHVFRLFPGVRPDDALLLRADVPRDITAHGASTINFGRWSMFAAAVGMMVLLLVVMNSRVGRPLARLTGHATSVGATGDLTVRLRSQRTDEIGLLSGAFDRMVERLAESQASLSRASRQAGMADVASSVLHNVGNALNSAVVTSGVMRRAIADSRVTSLVKVTGLLKDHSADLPAFLTTDPKGSQVPAYLIKAADELAQERSSLAGEADRLDQSLQHIQDIIRSQQAHAAAPEVVEPVLLSHVLSQVRTLVSPSLERHAITLEVSLAADLTLRVDRSRLEQVLVNLLTNAKQAVIAHEGPHRSVQLAVGAATPGHIWIEVRDQGAGFSAHDRASFFTQGFTTRQDGHGLGLHYCAVTMAQMGGTIDATSPGPGQGATFRIEVPIQPADRRLAA